MSAAEGRLDFRRLAQAIWELASKVEGLKDELKAFKEKVEREVEDLDSRLAGLEVAPDGGELWDYIERLERRIERVEARVKP